MSRLSYGLLINELTCSANFPLRVSEHPKVAHLHHASGEFCEEALARFRELSDDFLAYGIGDERGICDKNSLALQHIFVVSTVEGVGCGVDEDCVGSVTLRTMLLEKHSEVLIHGRVRVGCIILSREVVKMWEDSVAVSPTNGVCTCTTCRSQTNEV